jgi:hypothetical protein
MGRPLRKLPLLKVRGMEHCNIRTTASPIDRAPAWKHRTLCQKFSREESRIGPRAVKGRRRPVMVIKYVIITI